MNNKDILSIATSIVKQANKLCLLHAPEFQGHVSYCAFFSHSDEEFNNINDQAKSIGVLASDTATGPVYAILPIQTVAGPLRILKIRKPDPTRPEFGDADFALDNYESFKELYLNNPRFKLIEREHFEMIELMDEQFNVRAYFSNPPVEQHSGIKECLESN